jgi:hypothetical protein
MMDSSPSSSNSTEPLVRGWISSPNARGTFDIILSCVLTIFLCGWSVICVNVPAPEHPKRDLLRNKWHMFCLGMLAPEAIFLLAFGQYIQAHADDRLFRESNLQGWTVRHSFFANMGGFMFEPYEGKAFPIDAKQLRYLVVNKYIDYPSIDKSLIDDKNKSDGLARYGNL